MAAAGLWTPVNGTRQDILKGVYDLTAATTYKVALLASTSNISATSTTFAGVTGELTTANGYTAGGIAVTMTVSGTTSVPVVFVTNPIWTASGSGITARWAVLYKTGANVLAYVVLDATPADQSASAGNTFTIDSDGTPSPVFTLA